MRLLLGLWLAALSANAPALTVHTLEVSRDETVFRVVVDALIDATPALVRERLLDARVLAQLNPSVKSARASEEPEGRRVESELEVCTLGVCRRLLHVQRVSATASEISAVTLPVPGSSFKSGSAQWQLTPEAGGTRLIFTADTEPDLWLPPFVGPRLVMQQLRDDTLTSLQSLERLARE